MKNKYSNKRSLKGLSPIFYNFKKTFSQRSSLFWGLTIAIIALFLPETSISSEDYITSRDLNAPKELVSSEISNTTIADILMVSSEEAANVAVPSFSMSFAPATIGAGNITTLIFTIDNSFNPGTPITMVDFTDLLPAGMTVANPPVITSSCFSGEVTAVAGSGSISLTDGVISGGSICTITVNVTSITPGVNTNSTGDLTSSEGNSGPATANLTVNSQCPLFSKSFNPSTINFEERSTLTFTVDNTAGTIDLRGPSFSDNLPAGMVIASPSNLTSSCGNNITAVPGSSVVALVQDFNLMITAGNTCTITVDVLGNTAGSLENVTNNFSILTNTFQTITCGSASATLNVLTPADLAIQKRFITNPALPGGTTDLEFTITNRNRSFDATNISFTDDLTTVLGGLTAAGTAISTCGGGTLSGTTVLSFTGGSIPPQGSCTFTVPLQIPAGATPGTYTNITGAVTADINGAGVVGNVATEQLFIQSVPTFTKTFLTNPVPSGGTTSLEFTITNTSMTSALTDISFSDVYGSFLSGSTISNLPAANSCGAGSAFFQTQVGGIDAFQMTGGNIPAGGSCTFTIDITTPVNTAGGTYTNSTTNLTGIIDGLTVTANPATDDLEVLTVPILTKSFTNDPVNAGDIVNLEFTIAYDEFATGNATDVSFTDDLNAVIPGLAAAGLPTSVCGGTINGTTNLIFSGGTMAPGDVCTFSIPVQVPEGTAPGSYLNTTSALTATVGGFAATGNIATDNLIIGGLTLTKEFIDDTVIPGALTTLRFTIDNTTPFDATNVVFTDNLTSMLPGAIAEAPLPVNPCGGTFTASGNSFLILNGATVSAQSSCTFDVIVRVPATASSDTYTNITSNLTATLNGSALVLPTATDNLTVNGNLISLTKSFTNDPVSPGGLVNLEYTLTNLDPINSVSNIAFTDEFNGILTGLTATGLPVSTCGGTASGSGLFSFVGGSLAAGASCTFSISLQTPSATPYGTIVNSTTSEVTGTISGLAIVGDPASDDLIFQSLSLTKSMVGTLVLPGETTVITFTITNDDPVNAINQISFTDDLDAFISGTTATVLPAPGTCGPLSGVTGTSLLTFSRGSLDPGQSCSFDVTIQIPLGTPPNMYTNTTSTITGDGIVLGIEAPAATATLLVGDDIFPTITCPADISANVDSGICGAVVTYTPPVGTDNSPGATTVQTDLTGLSSGSTFPVGITTLIYTVTDVAGNATSCSFTITVVDSEDPVISCPADVIIECGNPTDPGITGTATGTDGCGTVSITFTDSSVAGCGLTETITRTWTATDGAGNMASCDQIITVVDINDPNISCPADATVECGDDISSANTGFATGTDGCGTVIISESDTSVAGCGNTEIITRTWTATDQCGNTATCVQTITVVDTTDPSISCPMDIIVNTDPGVCEATVIFADPTVSDACGVVTVSQIAGFASGSAFPLGTTTNTFEATDGCGNTEICSFTVTVEDNDPPVANCVAPFTIELDMNGEASITVADINNGSSDNCGIDTVVAYPTIFDCDDIGSPVTVTLTVTDTSGNTSSCFTIVTVEDNIAPDITVITGPITLWPPNHTYETIALNQLFISISDNCANLSIDDVFISRVTSDEEENGTSDGNTVDDIVIAPDCASVQLRKERRGNGNGRVYTIYMTGDDGNGNTTTVSAEVHVPKNIDGTAIADDVLYEESCGNQGSGNPLSDEDFSTQLDLNDFDQLMLDLEFSPNPTEGLLNIASPSTAINSVTIFDIQGRKVVNEIFNGNNWVQINISDLNSAMYFVDIKTAAGTVTKRLIKK